jgi:hypothetical protein
MVHHGGSEQFDRNNLIVILTSTNERRVYPIVSYDFSGTTVSVRWKNTKGETNVTHFGEFSAAGPRMVQLKSETGPRREFHRC